MSNPVVKEILRQGRGRNKRHVKAALEAGRIESNFSNPSGGDADSAGWRQERRSLYRNPTNIKASVRRFYKEAAAKDRGQKSYKLAADVQRPAKQYRGRYKTASREAENIIRKKGTKTTGGSSGRISVSKSSRKVSTFDDAGYKQALGKQAVARLLERHHRDSVLTRTGVLSAAPVDKAAFKGSKTVTSRKVSGSQGGGSQGGRRGGKGTEKGVADFEGTKVAAWIAPILEDARRNGWKGKVNSGYRSRAEQTRIYNSGVRPAAKPGTSNHEGSDYPRGAIDVSDPEGLNKYLRRRKNRKLKWAGGKDPVHFSHPHGGSY